VLTAPESHVFSRSVYRNGKLVVVDAGHFVWRSKPTSTPPIADWVAGGYREPAARGPTAAVMSPATDGGGDEFEQ
jgi:hypothetical protein